MSNTKSQDKIEMILTKKAHQKTTWLIFLVFLKTIQGRNFTQEI